MDCIIPRHSIRLFCSSLACWSRLGKEDLYLDFHPLEGLSLRTLNEASTAFGCLRYRPAFFERCTAPPPSNQSSSSSSATTNRHGSTKKRRRASSLSGRGTSSTTTQDDDDDTMDHSQQDDDEKEEGRFACRLSLKALAAIVRPRKQAISLRIQSDESNPLSTVLQFTFFMTNNAFSSNHGDAHLMDTSSYSCKVVHRIPADLGGVCHQPVLDHTSPSEMVATSRTWLQWLDPLKQTHEVAMVIAAPSTSSSTTAALTAASFHPTADRTLSAAAAATLKTETTLDYDDLVEMDYHQDRPVEQDMDDIDNDENGEQAHPDQPDNVNQEVVLVFPLKPVKALLQFCLLDEKRNMAETTLVRVSFTWGGQPVVWETNNTSGGGGDDHQHWSVQLVVATLDHKRLAGATQQTQQG